MRNCELSRSGGRNAYLVAARTWSKVLVGKIELFYAEGAVESWLIRTSEGRNQALQCITLGANKLDHLPGVILLIDEHILRCHLGG